MSKKVSIEVGHGGSDAGAVSGNFREKDITLVIALELDKQLKRHGVETLISRTTDVNDRAADFFPKAQAFAPDAGISVHINAGGGNGFEVYRRVNANTQNSNRLCEDIIGEVRALGQALRSPTIKDSQFLMDSLNCPTAYTELGFIDNPVDRARFDTPEKQRAFGVAYAKGILKFFGIAWQGETPPPEQGANTIFRVQCGAFALRANAERLLAQLKSAGFEAIIVSAER